jgi:flavin reductase (DIM6/NTAB) family NADH-FMN oxidoreductase RutF
MTILGEPVTYPSQASSGMEVDSEALRQTMRQWTSGVVIVTSAVGERRAGVTVSSFTSVTLNPPVNLVCLQTHIETYRLIRESGIFAVSMLNVDQAHLSAQFAGFVDLPEGADRFHGVETFQQVTGAPILRDSLAWMDCRVTTIYPAGTTDIVVGEVVATGRNESEMPLVYHNRAYYKLAPLP